MDYIMDDQQARRLDALVAHAQSLAMGDATLVSTCNVVSLSAARRKRDRKRRQDTALANGLRLSLEFAKRHGRLPGPEDAADCNLQCRPIEREPEA